MFQTVPEGDNKYKDQKEYIFQTGKKPCYAAFRDLWGGQFVKEFLDHSERTEPSADRSAGNESVEQEDPYDIKADLPVGG